MFNKNTLGIKKWEANQKQHCKQEHTTKTLISAEAKKLLYQNYIFSLNDICNSYNTAARDLPDIYALDQGLIRSTVKGFDLVFDSVLMWNSCIGCILAT